MSATSEPINSNSSVPAVTAAIIGVIVGILIAIVLFPKPSTEEEKRLWEQAITTHCANLYLQIANSPEGWEKFETDAATKDKAKEVRRICSQKPKPAIELP